jgi:drug/metabolite transporter (DMT)-like permease
VVINPTSRRLAYAALGGAGALWGASFLFGKIALEEMGAASLVFYRFVLAATVMLPFVRWRAITWTRTEIMLAVGGAVLAGPFVFLVQFEGLDRTTASSAALLVATAPPMLALGGAWLDRERPGRLAWIAVALSAVGVVLLVGAPGPGRTLLGDGLVFASMVAAVVWTLLARRLSRRIGPLATTAVQFALGAMILLPFVLVLDGTPPLRFSPGVWAALLALGLACTAVTFFLWNWGLMRVDAARAGVLGNMEPLVGTLLGVTFLGDQLGALALVGGGFLLGAAILATRSTDTEPEAEA